MLDIGLENTAVYLDTDGDGLEDTQIMIKNSNLSKGRMLRRQCVDGATIIFDDEDSYISEISGFRIVDSKKIISITPPQN